MDTKKVVMITGIALAIAIVGGVIWMNVIMRQTRKDKSVEPTKSPQFEPSDNLEQQRTQTQTFKEKKSPSIRWGFFLQLNGYLKNTYQDNIATKVKIMQ